MTDAQDSKDVSQDRDCAHVTTNPNATSEQDLSRMDTPSSGSKQKRKRTRSVIWTGDNRQQNTDSNASPRDHAILESAYQKNSKPDKDERLNLVKLVDLGEKEVQVRDRPMALLLTHSSMFADMVSKPSAERSEKIQASTTTRIDPSFPEWNTSRSKLPIA